MQVTSTVSIESITNRILVVRGQRVMLDADLARLYGVSTKRLNEQVKRNRERFPEDFMLRLSPGEMQALKRSQFATAPSKHRDPRALPYAFTEHGCLMLANVLRSRHAVEVSVLVVRAFARLREVLTTHTDLANRVDELAGQLAGQRRKLDSHEGFILGMLEDIRRLTRLVTERAGVEPSSPVRKR